MEELALKPISGYDEENFKGYTITKQDFNAGLMNYGVFIAESSLRGGVGTTHLYTVPDGKVLFIVGCWLLNKQVATDDLFVAIKINGVNFISFEGVAKIDETIPPVTYNFTIPVRVPAGADIGIYSEYANCGAMGGFTGYLVDADKIPLLLS